MTFLLISQMLVHHPVLLFLLRVVAPEWVQLKNKIMGRNNCATVCGCSLQILVTNLHPAKASVTIKRGKWIKSYPCRDVPQTVRLNILFKLVSTLLGSLQIYSFQVYINIHSTSQPRTGGTAPPLLQLSEYSTFSWQRLPSPSVVCLRSAQPNFFLRWLLLWRATLHWRAFDYQGTA